MTSEMPYRDGKREKFISYISILTGNHIAHPCRFMDKWVRPRVVEVVIIPGSQVPKHSGERHHDVAWAIHCFLLSDFQLRGLSTRLPDLPRI